MIRIVVDSSSDVAIHNNENITVVPLSITLNNKTYLDGVELGHDEFYDMLVKTDDFPKSSQPAPQLFVDVFEEAKKNNDTLLCIMLSSGVSGTYQSAVLAKNIVEYDNIYIVDSLTGSYGAYLLVQEAQKMIVEGKAIEEIVERIEELKKNTMVYLSVDTLEYLYRGGRLDKKSAMIGSIAKVKPIIYVTKEGTIGVAGKVIGTNRAMNAIVDITKEHPIDTNHKFYTICTVGTKNIEKLEAKLHEAGITNIERIQMGPVVGTHTGPETYGIIYLKK
ncbi:MAG: DegV family protein [Erysipelotrichaceae bacterium]|nr:DegV family protein [Erysipelotrichaceae bacterium]